MQTSTLVLAFVLIVTAVVDVHAQVPGKCLAAPPGELLIRTADGQVLRLGNAPPARPLAAVADAVAVAAYDRDLWLILRRDGTVLEIRERGEPRVVPGITNAIDIAAGEGHAQVLLADGTIRSWGYKTGGIPGDGTCPVRPCDYFAPRDSVWINRNPNCTCPARRPGERTDISNALSTADLRDAASIAAGRYWTFAVLRDGGLRAWGTDYQRSDGGMLGAHDVRNFALRPLRVSGVQNAVHAWSGNGVSAARMADGSWKVWGVGYGGVPLDAPSLQGAVAITNSVALFPDGGVKYWSRSGPLTPVFGDRAVALAVEVTDLQSHAALLADGRVLLFGHPAIFPNGPVSMLSVDAETVRQCSMLPR